MEIKRYKRDATYSYTLGMTLTIEMIKCKKAFVRKIYIHPNYVAKDDSCNIFDICDQAQLPYEVNQKIFNRLSMKDNVYVIGIFDKFDMDIEQTKPHIVLVNPSDSGNLGTILRTGIGFGFRNYVIIRPSVDIFDPKTVRSSMGAIFHIHFSHYNSFEDYRREFFEHEIYSFMLDGKINLKDMMEKPKQPFSLVFGNEGSGLPAIFHSYGKSIYIAHNNEIDSLNLSIAFGIAAHTLAD